MGMIGRRNILKGGAIFLVSLFAEISATITLGAESSGQSRLALKNVIMGLFKDRPDEQNFELLATELFGPRYGQLSLRDVRLALNRRRVDDFTNDQCANVDNWILVRSEAQVYGLIALL